MCLYPRLMKNPRKGKLYDERQKYVTISCGNCYECRRQKAQAWRVRLLEELKDNQEAYFTTLTFSNEAILQLAANYNLKGDNQIVTQAIRLFLERYRKKYKKTLRHWFITELGHESTERVHIHGIIFFKERVNFTNDELTKLWSYGRTDTGEYCNQRSINYIVKYVTKLDTIHKDYKAIILASPGIGERFIKSAYTSQYIYKKGETLETYTLSDGHKVNLPLYYRNKLYTDIERQKMWADRIDKNTIWVNGICIRNINTLAGYKEYMQVIEEQQKWNKSIGYGSTSDEWKKHDYNIPFKKLNKIDTQSYDEYVWHIETQRTPIDRLAKALSQLQNINLQEETPF